jgi:UDP-N-acetylmuramoylalanine--D-glutamate ligase
VRIADRACARDLEPQVAALRGAGEIEWRLGTEALDVLDGVDCVVVNPAVSPGHALVAEARRRGMHCTQEVELVLECFPGRVVLVTGTNGKSTTATMLARALHADGIAALLGGNVGHSLLADEPQWREDAVAVVEISSFQLERLDPARYQVAGAVFTPVTRDHLDRHGSLAAYHRAKAVAAAAARDFVVHLAEDEVARQFVSPARRRVVYTRGPAAPGQVGRDGGWVVSALDDPGPVLHQAALRLPGAFHVENAMAAFAAAVLLGARRSRAALALTQQRPLPYRLQRVLRRDGVELWDNAVSTEVQSTVSALETLAPPVHWVGGGKSKDGDFEAVARAVAPRVASAHLFGAAAAPLGALLRERCHTTAHDTLEAALDAAWRQAQAGGRVLFSPAFASFDQFANFRARAEAFHAWIARLR